MTDIIFKIKKILTVRNLELSVAESLTSGLLQAEIAKISGASEFFIGGLTTYSINSKVKLLQVDRSEAEAHNAVSPLVAEQMAIGVCKLFNTDIGLSTTGYAEPDLDAGISFPYAYISVCQKDSTSGFRIYSKKITGENLNRNEMRKFVVNEVLKMLLDKLE